MITEDRYKGLEACLELCFVAAHKLELVPSLANIIVSQIGVSVCVTVSASVCVCTHICVYAHLCVPVSTWLWVYLLCETLLKKIASHLMCNFEVVYYLPEVFCHSVLMSLNVYFYLQAGFLVHVAKLTFPKSRVDFCCFSLPTNQRDGGGSFFFPRERGRERM